MSTAEQMMLAYEQQMLSRTKKAKNQCEGCGVFRLDALPPTVHRHGCAEGPDGEKVGVLGTFPAAGNGDRPQGINPVKRPKLNVYPAKKAQAGRR